MTPTDALRTLADEFEDMLAYMPGYFVEKYGYDDALRNARAALAAAEKDESELVKALREYVDFGASGKAYEMGRAALAKHAAPPKE